MRLSDREEEPTCGPFPDLALEELSQGVSIALPISASYGRLATELEPLVVGRQLKIGTTGIVLTPTSVAIAAGRKGRLHATIDIELELPGFWESIWSTFRGTRIARIELETLPQLNRDTQVLSFDKTEIAATSDDWANILGLAVTVAENRLIAAFEEHTKLDLAPEADRAYAEADRAIASLGRHGLSGLRLSEARLTQLTLESVTPEVEALEVIAIAQGALSVTLLDLQFK